MGILRPPPANLPGLRLLSVDPLVYTIDAFADEAYREGLLEVARACLELPRVSGLSLEHDPGVRTGHLAWVPHDTSPATLAHGRRLAALVDRRLEDAESLQVVRYQPQERYLAHYDAYDLRTEEGRSCAALHGQREVTTLLYLKSPDAGGATVFPTLGIEVAPTAGRLLVFEDVGADPTWPHPDTLHAGAPVHAGEKWIASLWFSRRVPGLG